MESEVISTLTFKDNRLMENYFREYSQKKLNFFLNDRKGNPIYFDPNDYEWLSPTFVRNKEDLYGFSLILKSMSIKMFLTKVRAKVDFASFLPMNRYYAKDNNRYYYGPGGKVIKEENLELFVEDTYLEKCHKVNPGRHHLPDKKSRLWNTMNAAAGEKLYWRGRWFKEASASSLKQITQFYWTDNLSLFYYDLQNLKKIQDFDRATMVCFNQCNGSVWSGLVTDIHKPAHCYIKNREPSERYDFKSFAPLFEKLRGSLDKKYWWYKMEKELKERSK